MYRGKKIVFINVNEFNKHLLYVKKYRNIVYGPRENGASYLEANIEVNRTNVYLTYRSADSTVTYNTRLDGEENMLKTTGLQAYTTLCHYYKVPNMSDNKFLKKEKTMIGQRSSISWVVCSAVPLLWSNLAEGGKTHDNCYEYDMTSAYGWALCQPIPDTSVKPRYNSVVKEGEIGFLLDGSITFDSYAKIIFPLMESPFKRFVNKYFGIKKYGDKDQSMKAKQIINFAVGYMQRTNPFIRNTIVNRCTNKIISLIDDDTLYCNTDCIVSKKERKDLELGDAIGQFHVAHHGRFSYIGFNYQWNDEKPTYRGVVKNWFKEFEKLHKRPFNILYDTPPSFDMNEFYFDYDKIQIRRNKK